MKSPVQNIPLVQIKSKWYGDIFAEWHPDPDYIAYIQQEIVSGHYIAPIVVVAEGGVYYIVNGHHRYYAHAKSDQKTIKCIVISGTFADSEPLRKAEVLLKEFDQKTDYRYRFSGYLDRWAAAAEEQNFINKFRPTYSFQLYRFLKKIKQQLFNKLKK